MIHDTSARDPLIAVREQPFLDRLRQRRSANVEPQLQRGGHFVDVLPAGTLRAYR